MCDMAMTAADIDALITKVEAGTYTIEKALAEIAAAAKGSDVRAALYALAYTLNKEGKAGAVDLQARQQIANLIAHNNDTEGNSELVDIRVSADGTVYPSAGEAVRAQVSQLSEEVADLKENPVVKVDDTLTQEGMAADAKAVGEKISLITGDVVDEGVEATLHTLIYGDDTANF